MGPIGRHLRLRAYIAPLLTATMALVIAGFVAAITIADLRRIEAIYWSELTARGALLADHLQALLADPLYVRDLDQLDAVATVVSQHPDVAYMYVFTAEGVVLVDTRVTTFPPVGELVGRLGRRTLDDGQRHIDRQSGLLEVARPIAIDRQVLGGLGVGLRNEALPGQLQAVVVAHLWQGVLLIGLGVGLSYLVARHLTRPIHALAAATEQMAAGRLEARVHGVRAGELGRLAASFNRMAEELQGIVGQLRASRSRIVQAQEGVRREIAFHLHGRVQGRLLVLSARLLAVRQRADLPAEAARDLGEIIDRLGALIEEDVGALSRRLYPASLRRGLVPAIQSLGDQFETSLTLDLALDPALAARERLDRDLLPEPTRLAAYRIVEEALGNAVKHARARRAAVRLSWLPDGAVHLVVEDDGRGFAVTDGGDGLGLTAMQDCAGAVGGVCSVRSTIGSGTVVTATLPTGHGAHISAPIGAAGPWLPGWALARAPGLALRFLQGDERGPDPRVDSVLARQPELLVDRRAVGLDRALGQRQALGDGRVAVALSDQLQHVALPGVSRASADPRRGRRPVTSAESRTTRPWMLPWIARTTAARSGTLRFNR